MVETKNRLEVTTPNDTDIVMTRTFNAPRDLVFEAHTKPEHVRQWWGMRGSVLSICEIDFRVGGEWRWALEMPEGTDDVEFYGVYLEIERPARLVNTEVFAPFPDAGSTVAITLEERDGKTFYTSVASYPSKEVRDMVIESGMEPGASESLDRLEELAQSLM